MLAKNLNHSNTIKIAKRSLWIIRSRFNEVKDKTPLSLNLILSMRYLDSIVTNVILDKPQGPYSEA